jgi:hypothetical protein
MKKVRPWINNTIINKGAWGSVAPNSQSAGEKERGAAYSARTESKAGKEWVV